MDDFDSDAMAQAMGFASFGSQNPPSKRRRFNPAADAVVAAPDLAVPPRRPPPSSASNAVPLGIRPRAPQNKDEIDLDDGDDDNNDDQAAEPTTSRAPGGASTAPPSSFAHPVHETASSSYAHSRAADQTQDAQASLGSQSHSQGRPGGGQGPRPPWWTNYYDPSCNVNPWEHLEKKLGLEPNVDWMTWEEARSRSKA